MRHRHRRVLTVLPIVTLLTVALGLSVTGIAAADDTNIAPSATATASSSSSGYGPAGAIDGVIPLATTAGDEWASDEERIGAWIRLTWSTAQTISVAKLFDRSFTFTSNITAGTLSFSDGSSVAVGTLPEDGQTPATVSFAARSVTWVQFTVTGVSAGSWAAVGLAEFEIYGGSTTPPTPPPGGGDNIAGSATATASSSSSGYGPAGAIDGVIPLATTAGDEWASDEERIGAWIRLTWSTAQTISVAKLFDRSFTFTSNITAGTLSFSDGSSVAVGTLPEDGQTPATVSFAARSVTWVQFTVTGVSAGSWAAVGLAEFQVFGSGGGSPTPTTPPTSPPAGGNCPAGVYPNQKVSVIQPAYGATVSGANVTIKICAPGMGNVWARAWHQPDASHTDPRGYDRRFQNVAPDATGYAELTFPAGTYPRGPVAVLIDAWDGVEGSGTYTVTDTSYLQLYNTDGVSWNEGAPAGTPTAAGGKTLVFTDEFNGPLSANRTGIGATYATSKPDGPNGTEFGEGIFGDNSGANNPFSILGNQYLRIRAKKAPAGYVDPMGWGRQYITGNLSSARTDGTGIAFQYGYFEARAMLPAAPGTWSSLWLMSINSLPAGSGVPSTAEIDVMEQYGHAPAWSCQAQHSWATTPELHTNNCQPNVPFGDAANTWHRWGVNVTPTDTIYYIDDVEVWRQPTIAQAKTPMYYFLTLALGGGWPVDLSRYNNQVDMYVDYVRVYT